MRVLHVIDKSFIGGGQTVVANILRSFRGTDVTCSLACRDGGPLLKTVEDMGVPTHRVPFDKRFRPGPSQRIASIVRSESIDVIHSHGLVATTYCVMARALFGTRAPILYHQHGFHHQNYGALSRWLRVAAERAVSRRVAGVLAGSPADLELLTREGYAAPNHIHLVNYGIPEPSCSPEELERARAEAGVRSGDLIVGTVARLHPQKSVDVFLRAFALVRQRIPASKAVIIGTGPLEQELQSLSRTLGLDGHVVWLGGRSNQPYLPLFSVGVLSSSWEGLPQTLLEYMAGGTPVVTTNLAGCTEAIGPDGGVVVPIQDPIAMADGIVALLENRTMAKAMAEAARARFDDGFTLGAMTGQIRRIYDEVLS